MVEATKVLRELIEDHQKFIYVAQEPRERVLLTIAQALRPMEFAIVSTLDERLERWLHQRRFAADASLRLKWDQDEITASEWIPRFIETVASKIVVGLFRATTISPAQIFYAHVDHADYAAHMVLADSVFQEHSGFPMLADIARKVCSSVFGDSLEGLTENAYAAAGVPWRYFNGRPNRYRRNRRRITVSRTNRKNGELQDLASDLFTGDVPKQESPTLLERLGTDIESIGGESVKDPELDGAIGATMFDLPASEDHTVTVLLPKQTAQIAGSQSLVRIKSRPSGDGKSYLGIVTAGPFAEPDSLRADSHMLVTVATREGLSAPLSRPRASGDSW